MDYLFWLVRYLCIRVVAIDISADKLLAGWVWNDCHVLRIENVKLNWNAEFILDDVDVAVSIELKEHIKVLEHSEAIIIVVDFRPEVKERMVDYFFYLDCLPERLC